MGSNLIMKIRAKLALLNISNPPPLLSHGSVFAEANT